MKTIFKTLSLLAFLTISLTGFSQGRFSFGARAALTENILYQTDSDSIGSTGAGLGYSVGAVSELKIIGPLSIRVEALYSRKSFSEKATFIDSEGNTYSNTKVTTHLYYAELPVMAKLSIGAVVKPYLLLGGWGGVFLGGNVDFPENIPAKDKAYHANDTDYGVSGGLGIDINIVATTLFAELRTNVGLAPVDRYNSRLANIGIGAGLRF